jgi:hypothetical protein
MSEDTQFLYAAALTLPSSTQIVSAALVRPGGPWFYAETVDLHAFAEQGEAVTRKLRAVPGTTFVAGADLGAEMLAWIERTRAPGRSQQIRVDSELVRMELEPVVSGAYADACRDQPPRWGLCKCSRTTLAQFYERTGSNKRDLRHSLVDALASAYCDLMRTQPMDTESIAHLELVLGTKGALGYRAWARRHESLNPRLIATPAGDGEGGEALPA